MEISGCSVVLQTLYLFVIQYIYIYYLVTQNNMVQLFSLPDLLYDTVACIR